MEDVNNITALIQASVKDLKARGVIRYDSDISRALGINKGVLSNYLSGKMIPSPGFVQKFKDHYGVKDVVQLTPPPSGGWPGIPVYEASPITATNTEVYHDERIDKPDFYLNVPALRDCNYAARARGDSMHPKISNGDIVIGKELMDASVILFGEIYIVHTRNGIETVKYIHPCDDDSDCLELVPLNTAARKTRIMKTDIARLFEYRAVFKL